MAHGCVSWRARARAHTATPRWLGHLTPALSTACHLPSTCSHAHRRPYHLAHLKAEAEFASPSCSSHFPRTRASTECASALHAAAAGVPCHRASNAGPAVPQAPPLPQVWAGSDASIKHRRWGEFLKPPPCPRAPPCGWATSAILWPRPSFHELHHRSMDLTTRLTGSLDRWSTSTATVPLR
jgi:hypothetical protein